MAGFKSKLLVATAIGVAALSGVQSTFAAELSASGRISEDPAEVAKVNEVITNQGSNTLDIFFNHWVAILTVSGVFMALGFLMGLARRR